MPAIMAADSSPEDKLSELIRAMVRGFECDACALYLLRDHLLRPFATTGRAEAPARSWSLGEGLVGSVASNVETLNIADVKNHPEFNEGFSAKEGIFKSFLGAPIIKNEASIGVITLQSKELREFDGVEVETLQTISMMASGFVSSTDFIFIDPIKDIGDFSPSAVDATDIFISYSSADEIVARHIENILRRADYKVFAQFKDMPVGSNFVQEMKKGLQASRVIALLSPSYESSGHCQAEWNSAYAADPDGSKRKLVPLLIAPTELNFLAKQIIYENLIGVTGRPFEDRVLAAVRSGEVGVSPLSNIKPPVRHKWTDDAVLTVEGSAPADLNVGRGAGDLKKQLTTAKRLATKLRARALSAEFNYSKNYGQCLDEYVNELPTNLEDGNIFLCDAMARTLRNMFSAEADILDSSFGSELKTFLETHLGLRPYYPELGEFYASVIDGILVAPLDMTSVKSLLATLDKHAPRPIDSSVGDVLGKEEASAPTVAREMDAAPRRVDVDFPLPPPDPIGRLDRAFSRDQLLARTVNGMWSTFLKGRNVVPEVSSWRRAYEALEPHVSPILDYLRKSIGD